MKLDGADDKEGWDCATDAIYELHPHTRPETASTHADITEPPSSLSLLSRLGPLCLRLPAVVTALYFLFLASIASAVCATTYYLTDKALKESWSAAHNTNIAIVEATVDNTLRLMRNMAIGAFTLFIQSPSPIESNTTLAMLCAELAKGDSRYGVRVLALGSFALSQYASCTHGDWTEPDPSNMTAMMSDKNRFYGVYYIDPATYNYYDPPILKGPLNQSYTAAQIISAARVLNPIFAKVDAYLNETGPALILEDYWCAPANQPNSIYLTIPAFRFTNRMHTTSVVYPTDFAQTRIDGGMLLNTSVLTAGPGFTRVMMLINQSLSDPDPQVLSNTWGQENVWSSSYSLAVNTTTIYLTVSGITDPLMRAAVAHIDYAALQDPATVQQANFLFHGAPAAVTAWKYTSPRGFTVPIILASSSKALVGAYTYTQLYSLLAPIGAVLVMTALCYLAIDRYVARPLRRLTAAMLASVQRGARQPVRADPCDVLQLTETRELTRAYNTAMAQLRAVDEFVPDALRAVSRDVINASITESTTNIDSLLSNRPSQRLRQHYLTIVTVRITPAAAAAAARGGGVDTDALLRRHAADTGRGRFAELVNAVAGAQTRMACSGPFRGPAALAAFVAAVRELCDAHHGTVHRVAPDRCVLHFARSVRAALARQPAPADSEAAAAAAQDARMERSATADARAAVAFALRLQEWVAERAAEADAAAAAVGGAAGGGMPDVRVLVDTGLFTCGQYCASALQQTLSVALGRDAERAVGHVAAQLGVRVALTEETAVRVPGVRQLPVEALHTGRAGLDAAVIILYEALPGRVAGDTAWQLYMRCCFEGFHHMVQGDYAAALSQLRDVAAITDLEPGLLPRSLSREAASSSAVGGAVSTQVARLIGECKRRVARGHTVPFQRYRRVPLGVDAVLPGYTLYVQAAAKARGSGEAGVLRVPQQESVVPLGSGRSEWRYVVGVQTADGTVKRVLGGRPDWIRDNHKQYWFLPHSASRAAEASAFQRPYYALGMAGELCSVTTLVLRTAPGAFQKVLKTAPLGEMADELRSALPVHTVSAETRAAVKDLLRKQLAESHPYLRRPLSYSFSVEGCLTVLWELCPGGTLRDVIQRYDYLKATAMHRFARSLVTALSYLHERGMVHGFLSLDTVSVGADGVCRLTGRYTDVEADNSVFVLPRTCYVSPAVAAGHAPTAACDMFCYGLLSLEALTRQPAWRWADVDAADGDGEGGQCAAQRQEELLALMAEGGQAFSAAVVSGVVVPNTALLDSAEVSRRYMPLARDAVRALLSYTAAERPTAAEVLAVDAELLRKLGAKEYCVMDGDASGA